MKQKTLKILVTALSVVLVICLSVAGTLAYLQLKTNSVVNTFSPSNISLKLEESPKGDNGSATANIYQMVPGVEIHKDPKVTVDGDVDAYVFVEIVEAGEVTVGSATCTFDDFLSYAIAGGWEVLEGQKDSNDTVNGNETFVIWRKVGVNDATKTFSVLENDKVTTNVGVTSEMMAAYKDGSIKLTFTAYAIQVAGFENNENGAWDQAKTQQQG